MESCFVVVYFLQPCQLKVLKRLHTPFILMKGAQKMACCRKGKAVRYFHGLVKCCIRLRIRVFHESI